MVIKSAQNSTLQISIQKEKDLFLLISKQTKDDHTIRVNKYTRTIFLSKDMI